MPPPSPTAPEPPTAPADPVLTAEYTAEPVRLKMNGAICLRPLTPQQVETYLSRLGSQLDSLRATLNTDEVLQDLAQSPLMLSIMTLAYRDAPISALAGDAIETPEARRRQVFATYIDRMFARKGKAGTADGKKQTKSWLSYLAYSMQRHGHSVFLVEQMQPSWLNTIRQIAVYLFLSRLSAVAVVWAGTCSAGVIMGFTVGAENLTSEIKSA